MHGNSVTKAVAPRILVLCFDGLTGQLGPENTNVVELFSCLRMDDANRQRIYYQAGTGRYFPQGVASSLFIRCAKFLDEATAWYIDKHVMDGYKFLMQNYRKGDKICLFGLLRGAYTARALAGMLNKIGLLPADNFEQVAFVYKLYTRIDKKGIELAQTFKSTFCQDVKVEFVGVWDTVQRTGRLFSRSLPFTDSNTTVRTFRHALSLDPHLILYHRSPAEDFSLSKKVLSRARGFFDFFDFKRPTASNDKRVEVQQAPSEPLPSEPDVFATDILEVWFSSSHSEIGRENVEGEAKVLAQISLRWMVEQIIASNCGILFKEETLRNLDIITPLTPDTLVSNVQVRIQTKTTTMQESLGSHFRTIPFLRPDIS